MYRKVTDEIVVITDVSSNIEKLGGSFWMVDYNQDLGYHLVKQPAMTLPAKVYGHNTSNSDKIFDTFKLTTGRTTGVMLQGAKGTGKTLTASEVCIKAVSEGYPVILIQSEFYGTGFNDFMSAISEPCVVFIDEFEKVFKKQDAIDSTLMLLDGAIKTHKLFLLTSNTGLNESDKMEFLSNRPSRVRYIFQYGSIPKEVMVEYLQDNLKFPEYSEEIFALHRNFNLFTIDMLKAVVDEVNRFGDSQKSVKFSDIIGDLNVKTDRGISNYSYEKTVTIAGKVYPIGNFLDSDTTFYFGAYHLSQMVDGDTAHMSIYIPASYFTKEQLDAYKKTDNGCAVKVKTHKAVRCPINKSILDELEDLTQKTLSGEYQFENPQKAKDLESKESADEKVTFLRSELLKVIDVVRFELDMDYDKREDRAYYFTQDPVSRAIILNFEGIDLKVTWKPDLKKKNSKPEFII